MIFGLLKLPVEATFISLEDYLFLLAKFLQVNATTINLA